MQFQGTPLPGLMGILDNIDDRQGVALQLLYASAISWTFASVKPGSPRILPRRMPGRVKCRRYTERSNSER
jgi:hypothetical protein